MCIESLSLIHSQVSPIPEKHIHPTQRLLITAHLHESWELVIISVMKACQWVCLEQLIIEEQTVQEQAHPLLLVPSSLRPSLVVYEHP